MIAELESEKATFEVNAEKAGILKTVGKEGDTLKIGDVVAQIDETAAKPEAAKAPETVSREQAPVAAAKPEEKKAESKRASNGQQSTAGDIKATPVAAAIITDKRWMPHPLRPPEQEVRY